jgi:hypothetical protein
MRIGNCSALDAARNNLRDQFDAVWIASETIGTREMRAVRCAGKLDKPNHDNSTNWRIFNGGMACGNFNRVIYA